MILELGGLCILNYAKYISIKQDFGFVALGSMLLPLGI